MLRKQKEEAGFWFWFLLILHSWNLIAFIFNRKNTTLNIMDTKKGKKGKGKGKPDTKRSKKSNKSGEPSEVGSGAED